MNISAKRLIALLLILVGSISYWLLLSKDDLENTAGFPIVFGASMVIGAYFSILLDRYIPRILGLWIQSQKKRLHGLADALGVSIEDNEKEAERDNFTWWVWSRRLFVYICVSAGTVLTSLVFFLVLGDDIYVMFSERFARWLVMYSIWALLLLVLVLAPMVYTEVLLQYIERRLNRRVSESQRKLERLEQQQRDFERRVTRPIVLAPGITSLA